MKIRAKVIQKLSLVLILLATIVQPGYSQNAQQIEKQKPAIVQQKNAMKYKVTFIELGSVRCIPCQKMQPIMKSIETKYGKEVKVVFHDVWTPEGKPFAEKYGIEAIPTQVFLDENGKEFSRHEGYFPEEELVKVLKSKGVK
ncbi:MAG TPA: thioredoxin [Prolixibacteraceae bacterium]|nr:thioredoxin [Prolixibacteraceae bacterium]HCY41031.1 thioredoxin [Prolixibacteraceae bacterium]